MRRLTAIIVGAAAGAAAPAAFAALYGTAPDVELAAVLAIFGAFIGLVFGKDS